MKNLLSIFFLCLVGALCSYFLFIQYDSESTVSVSGQASIFYFLSIGEYSDLSSVEADEYIYTKEDDKYSVYVAITDKLNLLKVEEYYKSLGYDISIESFVINDPVFIKNMESYSLMLEKGDVKLVEKEILKEYEVIDNVEDNGDTKGW